MQLSEVPGKFWAGCLWKIKEIDPLCTKTAHLKVENTVTILEPPSAKALQNSIQLIEPQRLRAEMGLASVRVFFYSFPDGPKQNFDIGKVYICYTFLFLAFSPSAQLPGTPFTGFRPSWFSNYGIQTFMMLSVQCHLQSCPKLFPNLKCLNTIPP